MRISRLALLVMLGGLAACSSTAPTTQTYIKGGELVHFDPARDPYWMDPPWAASLFRTIQSAVHNPADPADTSTPGLHAVVKFTYQDGTAEYPAIVQGTGDPKKDELLLHQLAATQLPQATGVDADKSHEFVMDLDMPTPFESFEYSVFDAIDAARVYPKDAILTGAMGSTVVGFDYLDGKAGNITKTKSSGNRDLDQASLNAVTKATMPQAPAAYAGKTFHLESTFCYSLNGPGKCPVKRGVILVYGTRIRRVGF